MVLRRLVVQTSCELHDL